MLDPDSNVQFGEGGAGTFSDGKLNTLVKIRMDVTMSSETFCRGRRTGGNRLSTETASWNRCTDWHC